MKYRKKPVLTEATQWFKNGDHPQDEAEPMGTGGLTEGKVVRYFDSLDDPELSLLDSRANRYCPECGNVMTKHGVLDGANGIETVCPGDYIVTNREGFHYRLSRGEFESQYELYAPPPRRSQIETPVSDIEKRLQRRPDRRLR